MRENSYKSSYKRGLSPPNKGTLFETETEYLFVFSKLSVGVWSTGILLCFNGVTLQRNKKT